MAASLRIARWVYFVFKREFTMNSVRHMYLKKNGVAERKNKTLVETARTTLADSKLPVTFWAEAVNTACHVLNRVLTVKRHNKTFYELLNDRKLNLEYLLPFGNPCTLFKVRDVPTKFSAKAIEGIFLGYVANSTTKRVYNKENRQVEDWFHIDCSNRSFVRPQNPGGLTYWIYSFTSSS
ncbi:hypothetical protein L1987_06862 [Smallanthus sonchifolius]|uniref:Uncharacterized protein n=1 Tax=Smallanthus sonchifolius TaxID=185202 RepID=A0ACB9JZN6_9ASTR|nr:hypothetical protein L1987_06862 [Smallanthus sonchifolius]